MTIASPEPADLEERRAELATVLHSEHFTRAPMLAHLLSYLCEKLFAGEAHQIKEYSVGVEVFRRGDSFDQNSDSIVRVEANRLRKRLAAYYAGEGASHRAPDHDSTGTICSGVQGGRAQAAVRRRVPHAEVPGGMNRAQAQV